MKRIAVFAGLVFVVGSISFGEVRVGTLFGDHMVLQQKSKAAVWGWADPGEKVTVSGSWKKKASTKADKDGAWRVNLQTPTAGGPYTLTIAGTNTIEIKDVLIGEVWICSGQSNMKMPVLDGYPVDDAAEEAAAADYPQIRLFDIQQQYDLTPRKDVTGQWQVCNPKTVGSFSAVGYFFGRSIHEELKVPIGLIESAWGGTPAQAWTSAQTLSTMKEFGPIVKKLEDPVQMKRDVQEAFDAWHGEIDRLDTGITKKWFDPRFDDRGWDQMELPGVWEKQGVEELKGLDGIVWFRRKTMMPPSWSRVDHTLYLGAIDDIDTVWVNGVRAVSTAGRNKRREYKLPARLWRTGLNVVAVRVVDIGGEGGFRAADPNEMRIGPVGADRKTCASMGLKWKYKVSHSDVLPDASKWQSAVVNQNTPSVLYNGMIAPLIPYRIAGAIWYQGESNVGQPELYQKLFASMIGDWRKQWDIGEFGFYYVQIAPFHYGQRGNSAYLREAQLKTLVVPNTGMAVTMDIGEQFDVHPGNKKDVGQRLALWALAKTYGRKDVIYSGPIYKKMKIKGNQVRLSFDYVADGLVAKDGELRGFEIAGKDQKFVPAKAEIDKDTVVVCSEEVAKPVAVRYAFRNWAKPNLYNKSDLPASSFRTDDWPIEIIPGLKQGNQKQKEKTKEK